MQRFLAIYFILITLVLGYLFVFDVQAGDYYDDSHKVALDD